MKFVEVPPKFQPKFPFAYPAHQQGVRIEEYMAKYANEHPDAFQTSAVYLPVFWDSYAVTHRFGKDMSALQGVYDMTIRSQPDTQFWTICEYADGLMIDSSTNLHVFYCAREGGVTLPLLCDPHPVEPMGNPPYLATFIGAYATHPLRRRMADVFNGENCVVRESAGTGAFRDLMRQSWFALAPRGYGATSYRLYEAIQCGCIPVYISDVHLLPFEDELDWNEFCVVATMNQLPTLPRYLESIPVSKRREMLVRCREVYRSHFNMESVCGWVAKYLNRRWPA